MSIQIVRFKKNSIPVHEFCSTLTKARNRYRELQQDNEITIGDIRDAITRVDFQDRFDLIKSLNNIFAN